MALHPPIQGLGAQSRRGRDGGGEVGVRGGPGGRDRAGGCIRTHTPSLPLSALSSQIFLGRLAPPGL